MERTREMVVGGRYRLRSKLGKGGMGTVWRAFDESLHREVALKVIYKISSEDEVVDRFRQEARAAARIRHINIVEIFDQGEDDEHHFISMELVDGSSLDKHLRQRRFSWQEILQITAQMCDGVSAAHSHGIIHRDLKPANIVLTQDSKGGLLVKVLDFGVAANLTPGIEAVQTQVGGHVGTPAYIAPELLAGRDPDRYTKDPGRDIYAIGVILYEMIAGRRPFLQDDIVTLALTMAESDPSPPSVWAPQDLDVPEAVDRLVMWALNRDPSLRLGSLHLLAEELESALRRSGCLGPRPVATAVDASPKASTSGLDTAVFNPVTPAEVTGNSVRPMVTSAALPLPRATRLGLLWIPVVCIAIGGGAAAWMQLGASRTETSTDAQTEAKGNRLVTLPEEPKPPVEEVIEQERLPGPPTEPEPPQELEPQSGSPGGSLAERGKRALLAGDFERAERLLTRCVEKYDRPDCHRSLAIAYQQRGDWRKVITHIRRYLVLVPEPVDKPQLQELLRSAEAQAQTKRPGDPPSPATAKRIAVSLIGSGPYGVGLIFVELDGKPWPKGHRSASPSQLSLSEGTHTLRYHRRDNPQTQLVRFQVVPAERVIDIEAITARPDE